MDLLTGTAVRDGLSAVLKLERSVDPGCGRVSIITLLYTLALLFSVPYFCVIH